MSTFLATIPVTAPYRYERKMPTDRLTPAAAIGLVRKHPAGFREIYEERTINNVYLDTVRHHCLTDAEEGVAERYKARIRWYGTRTDAKKTCLELKIRSGLVQRKELVPLPVFQPAVATRGELQRILENSSCQEIGINLAGLQPSLYNCYNRRYFLSADQRFRITVDWGIRYPRATCVPQRAPFRHRAGQIVVIELKYSCSADADAQRITQVFPVRVGRYSKYVEGMR